MSRIPNSLSDEKLVIGSKANSGSEDEVVVGKPDKLERSLDLLLTKSILD